MTGGCWSNGCAKVTKVAGCGGFFVTLSVNQQVGRGSLESKSRGDAAAQNPTFPACLEELEVDRDLVAGDDSDLATNGDFHGQEVTASLHRE